MIKHNALLSSEARYTNASALLRNHKTHRKPKMPRVPNLLEQFVMCLLSDQTSKGIYGHDMTLQSPLNQMITLRREYWAL
ncbi:hypothetical protein E2I22_08440 [Vibrio vulnificus]|nr:hypothetical protein E2I22_08440 [Vibrio vulnificus]